MSVFIDTSSIFAHIDVRDDNHRIARSYWDELAANAIPLYTTNYILTETFALVGRRLGRDAVQIVQREFVPLLQITWIDAAIHERAVAALLAANQRRLSLVDCVSFEVMRQHGLDTAFTFDSDFGRQGFRCVP